MLKRLTVVAVLCSGLASHLGSAHAQGHFGEPPSAELASLPTRARKSAAPDIKTPLQYEALRHETYPGLRGSVLVGESVMRLVGAGFGSEPGGRTVVLTLSTREEPVVLTVLSWRDDEIRVQVPSLSELGVDAKQAAALKRELTGKKRIVGPSAELGIRSAEGVWVEKPRHSQLAVVFRDLDGDGHDAHDCDDFDGRRAPGRRELSDADGLDEDCNPETHGEAALATLDDPTL
jgi:hypothetical protein